MTTGTSFSSSISSLIFGSICMGIFYRAYLKSLDKKNNRLCTKSCNCNDDKSNNKDKKYSNTKILKIPKQNHNSLDVMKNLHSPVIATDEIMNIIYVNHSVCKNFGYTKEELLGKSIEILMPIEIKRFHAFYIKRYNQSGKSLRVGNQGGWRIEVLHKNGSKLPYIISISHSDDKFVAIMLEQRPDEAKFQKKFDDQIEVSENLRYKLNYINHEVRGALMQLSAMIDLSDSLTKKERQNMEHVILSATTVLTRNLNAEKVLLFSGYKIKPKKVSIIELVETLKLRSLGLCKSASIILDFKQKNLENKFLMMEKESILMSAMNLVTNSVKFANKKVEINVAIEDELFFFSITDDGPGIPEEYINQIWFQFIQTDEGRKKKLSSGLGLPIVKRQIEAHESGQVGCVSKLGNGATFWFSIKAVPCHDFDMLQMLPKENKIDLNAPEIGVFNGRVLLVDDSPAISNLLSRMFTKYFGHKDKPAIETCLSGSHILTLSKMELLQYDVIILDNYFELDEVQGPEVAKYMMDMNQDLFIFGLTGSSNDLKEVEDKFIKAGAIAVYIKPINISTIQIMEKIVNSLLKKRKIKANSLESKQKQ